MADDELINVAQVEVFSDDKDTKSKFTHGNDATGEVHYTKDVQTKKATSMGRYYNRARL